MCSDSHFSVLACYAVDHKIYPRADLTSAQEIGELLHEANVRSLQARYPHDWQEMTGGGFVLCHWTNDVTVRDICRLPAERGWNHVAILKLVDCYGYQACEVANWQETSVYEFLARVRRTALEKAWEAHVYASPEYARAPWGL